MVHLKDPPLPKNKNWLAGMAVLIFGLAVLSIVLMGDVIEKPKKDRAIQKQIVEVEHKLEEKNEALHASAKQEAETGNNFDKDTVPSDDTSLAKFSSQEKKLSGETTPEPEYLQDRIWGFWYIMLPLFVLVGFFLYWVWKKHKSWTR